jgi:hypothetical protein
MRCCRLKRISSAAEATAMAEFGADVEADLHVIDVKLKQLRLDYDQYFLGGRKREPTVLRGEVTKMVMYYANVPIRNTALRFQFNNLRARFFSHRRLWDETLRKIEEGRFTPHQFQADLHAEERSGRLSGRAGRAAAATSETEDLYTAYVAAREATGQGTAGLTRERFAEQLARQQAALREKLPGATLRFRVVVEGGQAKLKATAVRP